MMYSRRCVQLSTFDSCRIVYGYRFTSYLFTGSNSPRVVKCFTWSHSWSSATAFLYVIEAMGNCCKYYARGWDSLQTTPSGDVL